MLPEALTALGVMAERAGRQVAQAARRQGEPTDDSIEGTERRRQRPKNPEKQALHYSGKKKMHRDKHVVSVPTRSKRGGYLSPTYSGKPQDNKMAEEEQMTDPRQTVLHKETGFHGSEPKGQQTQQPQKHRAATTGPRTSNDTLGRCRVCVSASNTPAAASSVHGA